ncbi:uncharacterized protein isoform X2 [Musca autumnalis]|uniref:uncharacterized protein isoform X2 n=1 Tax=Musca autumnalis TaxID=221902 RepID=UPI003CEBE7EA
MSRKNRSRLANKQRKSFRQKKKIIRKLKLNKTSRKLVQASNMLPHHDSNEKMHQAQNIDAIPSTSQAAVMNNKKSPQKYGRKSPLKAGYINKFQKFRDDKAKKLLKRSKLIMLDLTKSHQNRSNNANGGRLYLNKSARKQLKTPKQNKRNINLINNKNNRSRTTPHKVKKSLLSKPQTAKKDNEKIPNNNDDDDDDDDCILIEKTSTQIIIDDDSSSSSSSSDDDDDSDEDVHKITNSKAVPEYQSLFQSFSKRGSSTPCNNTNQKKRKINNNNNNNENHSHQYSPRNLSYANVVANTNNSNYSSPLQGGGNDLFFVDVNSNAFLGNIKYIPRKPLGVTATNEVEKDDNDDVIVVPDNDTTLKESTNNTANKSSQKESSKESTCSSSSSESSEDDSSSDEEEEGEIVDTNKNKSRTNDTADDSVVFVSETNNNNFIPLSGNGGGENNRVKSAHPPKSSATTKAPMYSDLFTRNEKKQLESYNSNAYNPNAGEGFTAKKRPVIIDGSNVAFKHSLDKGFSVKGLKIAIEYFESMGHEVKAVIPQFRMNQNKSTDPAELDRLHKSGKIVQTPCKNLPGLTSTSYDDRFILQLACAMDAAIVSNDNYRDLLHENPAFKKIIETRVIGYTWCNDIFILPKDPYGKWGPTLDMILNRS